MVTGASRGIGRACALALAARRKSLALLGRDSLALRQTLADCLEHGAPAAHFVECDLAEPVQIEQAAKSLLERCAAPEVLIHNAGIVERGAIGELALASFQAQLAVNLTAPFCLTNHVLPAMRAEGRGRVLFVASISSTLGTKNQSAYCASKWGVLGLMKSLAQELSDTGLMTAAVLPGSVDTDMLHGSGFAPRMSAAHVAQTLVYLALDAPLAHNGATIEMFGT